MAMEAGGGAGGVEAIGRLAGLWRGVYQKAAEAAEARLGALLAAHVYRLHGRRAVAVVLDGGAAPLTPGVRCDLELPWAYVLEGWALYAGRPDGGGTLRLDLRVTTDYGAFPSFVSICAADANPTLGDPPGDPLGLPTDKNRDDLLEDWAVAHPRGTILRVEVLPVDPAALPGDPPDPAATPVVTQATLTLFLRAV